MSTLATRISRRVRRARSRAAGGNDTARQIQELQDRVKELEVEMLETRQHARRIAELTDVVEQLLLPEEVRDGGRLEERLRQVRTRG